MANYPASIYSPRVKENRSGIVYDATKKNILFVEDLTLLENEVIALETFFKFPTSIPASPVAGSAYFTVVDFTLHIYTGAAWKTIALS
jgi:hypothetical protein